MSVVIKIGGCNGSGKTSLVRAIMGMKGPDWQMRYSGVKRLKPESYTRRMKIGKTSVDVYILGSYETICGGMDTISDKNERLSLIEQYACSEYLDRLVIFEGLITGKTYGAIGSISDQPSQKGRWIYAFMDTPFDVCVERVLERRKARGNTNPFDPERTMRPTYRSVELTAQRAQREGHHVHMVDHTLTPEAAAKKLLKAAAKVGGW